MWKEREMPRCKACGAPIWFIRTTAGKTMPVNEQPVPFVPVEGGRRSYLTEDGVMHRGRDWKAGENAYYDMGYVSHFATCPKAEHFRRRGKADADDRGDG
jgi:hypothetical protein